MMKMVSKSFTASSSRKVIASRIIEPRWGTVIDQTAAAERLDHRQCESEAEEKFDDDVGGRQHRRQRQGPAGNRIDHDLLEILQADEGVAGDLEIVIDERDPDREEEREDRKRED